MILIGEDIVRQAAMTFPDARKWIETWIKTVLAAEWRNLMDVRKDYPHADGVKLSDRVVTVFNVAGRKYRLITLIAYRTGAVRCDLFLTHAEYNKEKWKR